MLSGGERPVSLLSLRIPQEPDVIPKEDVIQSDAGVILNEVKDLSEDKPFVPKEGWNRSSIVRFADQAKFYLTKSDSGVHSVAMDANGDGVTDAMFTASFDASTKKWKVETPWGEKFSFGDGKSVGRVYEKNNCSEYKLPSNLWPNGWPHLIVREVVHRLSDPKPLCINESVESLHNEPPTVKIEGPTHVQGRAEVKLTAIGKDKEGAALEYKWERVKGPEVAYSAKANVLKFKPSDVAKETAVTFKVTVTEKGTLGNNQSAATTHTIRLVPEPEKKEEPKKTCPNGFVFVKGGEFWMGSTEEEINGLKAKSSLWADNEGPRHLVRVDDFCMQNTEVTNKGFPFIGNPARQKLFDIYSEFKGENKPAVFVNWSDANNHCLSKGWRLPTEAEWERAARGPSGIQAYPTADGKAPTMAQANWGYVEGRKHATDVGSFAFDSVGWPQPDGSVKRIYDMAGNVLEWVSDYYANRYIIEPGVNIYKNPAGPQTGETRVLRGGSWSFNNGYYLRAADRYGFYPDVRSDYVGFRCAAPVLPEDSPKKVK